LADALAAYPELMVFGEDVGRKGGVYGVTRGLARRFGAGRVFDTLLDEQSILGVGLGAGVTGLLPVPEIQYLAYLHTAEDQLRGEAASLQFSSAGQFRNQMAVRVARLAVPVCRARAMGGRARADRPRPHLRQWLASHARDLRQRGADVVAGGQAAGRDRDRRPRPGSAVAGPAARRRPAARG